MPKLDRRHKLSIIALAIYLPALFVLTHIKIPDAIRSSGVSDKMMHFLAYMILTFFLYVAINPLRKVHWLKWQTWLTLIITVAYGAFDEFSQSFVGRGTSIHDFAANMVGVFACLIILTFLSFWPASMLISAILIYTLPNFTTGSLFAREPIINTCFHFFGFAGFTMIWIQVMDRFLPMRDVNFKWPLTAMLLPMFFLAAVKVTTALLSRDVWKIDFATAIVAILIIVGISWPTGIFRYKVKQKKQDNAPYKW